MNARLQRAQLLLHQRRYDLAEQELRLALVDSPDDPMPHATLAFALLAQERKDEALAEAGVAIGHGPGEAYCHYVMASVLHSLNRYVDSRAAAEEALRLAPDNPDYWGLLASIHASRELWKNSLEAADHGLEFDAEHERCVNLRAIALVHLNRRGEAGLTIGSALNRDPHSAVTHANMGWTLLHEGDPTRAMEHFREALRIDPTLEWAHKGIVESLKARNFIYRQLLAYMLWLARLNPRVRIAVIVGLVVLMQLTRLPTQGVLLWLATAAVAAYFLFTLTVWTAVPFFNLLLRLDRTGRLALNDNDRRDSTWLGAAFAVILALVVSAALDGKIMEAVVYLFLAMPIGVTLNVPREARRNVAALVTFVLFGAAILLRYAWFSFHIPFDIHNEKEGAQYLEAHPDFMASLNTFLDQQQFLMRVVIFGSVGMTWLAPLFRRRR